MMSDKTELLNALQIIQKYNLKETEHILKKEAQILNNEGNSLVKELYELQSASDEDPSHFEEKYDELLQFIENSLDIHKPELSTILYPVFTQMYLRLVASNANEPARQFMSRFRKVQDTFYQEDIDILASLTCPEHLNKKNQVEQFESRNFVISMSCESHILLKRYLQEKSLQVVQSIITDQLDIDVFDGPPRSKLLVDSRRGATFGESKQSVNKTKMLYGLLKEQLSEIEAIGRGQTGPTDADAKKKKPKKDTPGLNSKLGGKSSTKSTDNNAPKFDRIPLPELRDSERDARQEKLLELSKRVHLGRLDEGACAPSVCNYSIVNAFHQDSRDSLGGAASVCFTDDSKLLALGLASGVIQIFSLVPNEGLKILKSAGELETLSKDDPNIRRDMFQNFTNKEQEACHQITLTGHCASVNAVNFNNDGTLLLSCSSDGSVRLWCCYTWSNIAVFKDHMLPVWCVKFSPAHGYYFVTGSQDRTARLWSTFHSQPLRVFVHHLSDVTAVDFHPNTNYVATGCADRAVRVFDCLTGKIVRMYTGHKGQPMSVQFSPDGRYLVSACWSGIISLWDLAKGEQVGELSPPDESSVLNITFCRDGNVLASACMDCSLQFWDVKGVVNQYTAQRATTSSAYHSAVLKDQSSNYLIGNYRTKNTPILGVHFTRRNLVLTVGPFNQKR